MDTKFQTTFDIAGDFLKLLKETINQLVIPNCDVATSLESLEVVKIMNILNHDLRFSGAT